MKALKIVLKTILIALGVLFVVVAAYLAYVIFSYSRIEDNLVLEPKEKTTEIASSDKTYTIVTQNIGFGAYTPSFTFFMDGGKQSRAESRESVVSCVEKAALTVKAQNPDFVFFQEVDTNSDRSYHVDQREILDKSFTGYSSVFAQNYHSAYLFYPLYQPHGKSNSGIYTYSKYKTNGATRRSLPISTGFGKFLDLDRCYSVTRVPLNNGKELVLYNVHLSAYGGSDEIREGQLGMLLNDMKTEYEKGNYCVCGGDFNHDFTGDSTQKLNGVESNSFGWAQPLPADILDAHNISRAINYDELVPTCRNCDVPYKKGNFTVIVDGFLYSQNVEVMSVKNVDTEFSYSDHNPVVMSFRLK